MEDIFGWVEFVGGAITATSVMIILNKKF